MEQKTRVEKYKKHRQEIQDMDTYRFDSPYSIPQESDDEKGDIAMNEETLQTEHIKKSTLSISLDQLIKAHDEYTIMMSQEEIKQKKQEEKRNKMRKIRNVTLISLAFIVVIVTLVVVILLMWK